MIRKKQFFENEVKTFTHGDDTIMEINIISPFLMIITTLLYLCANLECRRLDKVLDIFRHDAD